MHLHNLLHYIEPWLLPPGCNILFILIACLIFLYHRTLGKIIFFLSIATLWIFSAPIFSYNLIEILQNQYPTLTLNFPSPERGVIVILGGGDDTYIEHGKTHAVSDVTLNRIRYGAYLHKKTQYPIIVSGGNSNGSPDTEADLMANTLKENFDITNVIKEDKSLNTADESKFILPLIKEHGFNVVYLVTNAWHMPRSVYIFKHHNIDTIPAPMGYEVYDHHYTLLSYLPNIQALKTTTTALHELIGLAWYHWYY